MNTADHKCESCGAPLDFNINTQTWICKYCRKEYTLDMLKGNIDKYNNVPVTNLDVYECSNCGAKLIGSDTVASTKCLYCRNTVIVKKRLDGIYKPDYIITFKKQEQEIKNILYKHLKSKIFSYKDLSNKITEITKLYVPYWIITCDVMASIKGILYYQTKNSTVNKTCYRRGVMHFDRVPADAKRNLNDDLLQGIEPFNYDELVPFEYPYLAGIVAECYDQNEKEIIKEQIKSRIEEAAEEKLRKSVSPNEDIFSVHERSTFIKQDKIEYALVPIWFIKVDYKGKTYEYCVNDQTGKTAGIYPINPSKVSLAYAILTALVTLLTIFLAYITNNFSDGTSIYFYIFFITSLYTVLTTNINSYKKIKKGKKSSDYIDNASFHITESFDRDSF